MHNFGTIANYLAVVSSLIAMIVLYNVSNKIGGTLGKMLKYLFTGIFVSIFLHAIVEILAVYQVVTGALFLNIMGMLLTTGSILLIVASYFGNQALK